MAKGRSSVMFKNGGEGYTGLKGGKRHHRARGFVVPYRCSCSMCVHMKKANGQGSAWAICRQSAWQAQCQSHVLYRGWRLECCEQGGEVLGGIGWGMGESPKKKTHIPVKLKGSVPVFSDICDTRLDTRARQIRI